MTSRYTQQLDQRAVPAVLDRIPLASNNYRVSTLSNVTKANPAVVTAVSHGFSNGDRVYIFDVVGMTELNDLTYEVANVTTNTFRLLGVNSTSFGTYVSGGKAVRGRLQYADLEDIVGLVDLSSVNASLTSLDGRLDTAESEIDALQAADVSLDGRIDTLETNYTLLDGRLDTAETDINAVEASVTTLGNNLTTLTGRVDDLEEAIEDLDVSALETRVDALEAYDATVETRLDGHDAADISLDGRLDTAEAAIVTLDGRLDVAEPEIDALQAADVALDTRLDTAEADIVALEAVDTVYDGRLDALEAEDVAINARIDAIEEDIADLDVSALEARVDDLEAYDLTVETRLDGHDAADIALDGRLDTAEGEIDALQAADVSLDGRIDVLEAYDLTVETRLDGHDAADVALDGRLDTAEATLVSLDGRLDTAETDIAALEAVDTAYDSRLDALEAYDATVETRLDGHDAADVALDGRLDTAEATLISLDGRLDTAESDIAALEAADVSIDGRLDDLEAYDLTVETRLDGHDVDISDLEAADVVLDGRLDTAESDIAALEAADVSLDSRLDAAEADIAALEAADVALDGRLDTAEAAIVSLDGRLDTAEATLVTLDGRLDTAESEIDTLQTDVAGLAATRGRETGFNYKFNNATSGDATAGKFRFNHATIASVTQLAIHPTDDDGNDLTDWIGSWDNNEAAVYGYVHIKEIGVTTSFAIFQITGVAAAAGSSLVFVGSIIDSGGTLSNNDETIVTFQTSGVVPTRLVTAEGEIDALQAADVSLDGRLDTAEADIAALEAADVVLDGRLDTAESDIAALEAADVALDGRLDTAEATLISLDTRLDTAESDISALEAVDTAYDGRLDALEAYDLTVETRLDDIEADIADLDVTALEARVDDLEAYDLTVETRLDALEAADVVLDGRLDTAESDIAALEAADVSLDGRLDTAEADIAALEAVDLAYDGRLDALEAADIALDGRLDTAESEIDALQAADILLDGRLDTIEAEYVSLVPSTSSRNLIVAQAAAARPLGVKAHATQSADLFALLDSSNGVLATFDEAGRLAIGASDPGTNKLLVTGSSVSFEVLSTGVPRTTQLDVYNSANLDGRLSATGAAYKSGGVVNWSSTGAADGTPDLGLARLTTSYMRVTDGSTGYGGLRASELQVYNSSNLDAIFWSGGIGLKSSSPFYFSSTTSASGTADLGFARDSAGVGRITDGSTGTGTLRAAAFQAYNSANVDASMTTGGFSIKDGTAYYFSSTSAATGAKDCGLARDAAGRVKVTDGSSGYAALRATQYTAFNSGVNDVRIQAAGMEFRSGGGLYWSSTGDATGAKDIWMLRSAATRVAFSDNLSTGTVRAEIGFGGEGNVFYSYNTGDAAVVARLLNTTGGPTGVQAFKVQNTSNVDLMHIGPDGIYCNLTYGMFWQNAANSDSGSTTVSIFPSAFGVLGISDNLSTGRGYFAAGLSGTPAVNVGDTNTGLYRHAAGILAVSTLGTRRALFNVSPWDFYVDNGFRVAGGAMVRSFQTSALASGGTTNNWTGPASGVVEVTTGGGNHNITGLNISPTAGQTIIFIKEGAGTLGLLHADAGSTAGNRFAVVGAVNLALNNHAVAVAVYTGSVWKVGRCTV